MSSAGNSLKPGCARMSATPDCSRRRQRETPAPEITSEPVTVYPGDKNGLPYDVVVERLHIDEPEPTPPEPAPPAEPAGHRGNTGQLRQDAQNFRITGRPPGRRRAEAQSIQANITAIRLLKELEAGGPAGQPGTAGSPFPVCGLGRPVPDAFDPSRNRLEQGICRAEGAADPGGIRGGQGLHPQRPLHQPYGDPRHL